MEALQLPKMSYMPALLSSEETILRSCNSSLAACIYIN